MMILARLTFLVIAGACLISARCEADPPDLSENDLQKSVVGRLCATGSWSPSVAEAYWTVNRDRLTGTAATDPKLVDKEINLLSAFPPISKLQRLLENEPEASGLALLALDKGKLASAIVDAPKDDEGVLVASYLFCTTGQEVDQWSEAIARHAPVIAAFQRRCAALPYQGLFSYLSTMRVPEARWIYGQWLDDVLAPAVLSESDDTMSSRLDFVASTGAELRKRLESDVSFRQDFLSRIWPHLRESILRISREEAKGKDIFFLCGSEPSIWDFFRRDDAPVLFQNAGMDAVSLFSGQGISDPTVRRTVAALWSKGILDLPRRMIPYQNDTHFQAIVNKLGENNWALLNATCLSLMASDTKWPQQAAYFDSLSPVALGKELHPQEPSMIPGASLVSLVDKFIDGRRVNTTDWIGAGMDGVDLVCFATTLGGSAVVGEGAKEIATVAAKKALQQTLRTEAEQSMEKLAGRTLRVLGREVSEEEWTQAVARQALEQLPEAASKAIIRQGMVDITTPVQAGFRISRRLGMNREFFKLLTRLEARVFMRADGRVFINLTNAALAPSPAARFLTRKIEEAAKDSEVGRTTRETLEKWQQDVSAWWSGNATGQFDVPATGAAVP